MKKILSLMAISSLTINTSMYLVACEQGSDKNEQKNEANITEAKIWDKIDEIHGKYGKDSSDAYWIYYIIYSSFKDETSVIFDSNYLPQKEGFYLKINTISSNQWQAKFNIEIKRIVFAKNKYKIEENVSSQKEYTFQKELGFKEKIFLDNYNFEINDESSFKFKILNYKELKEIKFKALDEFEYKLYDGYEQDKDDPSVFTVKFKINTYNQDKCYLFYVSSEEKYDLAFIRVILRQKGTKVFDIKNKEIDVLWNKEFEIQISNYYEFDNITLKPEKPEEELEENYTYSFDKITNKILFKDKAKNDFTKSMTFTILVTANNTDYIGEIKVNINAKNTQQNN
ncbi:hypothetical protein SHELI_v1c04150 [Spiroplasma helicoides]|uniref:Lipoprotein n=1 Tax=Spiroplasma helicoides TaxID=216938 RepID=A0A1B3SKB0_9MOLU|nr:hypothetical protein [Spiroplasma helicoides]AOG60366.1 hypothetical protein SHELI_v1c04150 [Spiroplasma helicoides]